jgi:hypothetical protein
MKLTKLMLSAFVAALALVSCNKQETTPIQTSNRLKTVEISLENIIFTKGPAGDPIANGQKITVKDFQIFLLDAAGNEYKGKSDDGAADAKSYWNSTDLVSGLPLDAAFHYVDPNCTKVVAVANMGTKYDDYAALKNALATPLAIGGQQDQNALALYAESTDFVENGIHESDPVEYDQPAYKVSLTLKPRISRFEIDGFSVILEDPANPKYGEIKITQLAFQNYYPNADLLDKDIHVSGTLVNPITDFTNQSAVYTWLDGISNPNNEWFRDSFDITLNSANGFVQDLPEKGKLAYHMFSCDEAPVFVLKLLVDGQPAYLYTKNLKDQTNTVISAFEPGKIYRMSGEGEVDGSTGTIEIPEDKIDPMDRCLDITVDVMSWEIVLVKPEF